jgi:hypothetical protein
MNQIDSYKIIGRRGYFEPVKLIGNSENFEHFKSVMSSSNNNLNKKPTTSWSSAAHESNSIEQSSPLFVKSISQNFKIKNKFNIKFLKDSDQISSQQSRVTVYDSIINNSGSNNNNNNNNNKIQNSNVSIKSNDFFTSANDSFFSNPSSRKYKSKSASNNYHFMQSQPSSASNGNLKLKITNLTIKHATIDMNDQLAMIPDSSNDNQNSYVFGDKAKLLAKLIEKSSNLEEKSLCCIACSKKKSIDSATLTNNNNNNKLSIQNLYLNVDLEKSLRINDDLNESSLNNTSYSNWNTSSLFMKSHSKYNTKLDRQFKKIVPNPNATPLVSKSRVKSSKNESVYANHFQAMKSNTVIDSSSRNSQHSILGSVNGTSIKLKFPNLNKDLLSENISLNSEFNNKTGFETNQYATTSLYEFSTGKT